MMENRGKNSLWLIVVLSCFLIFIIGKNKHVFGYLISLFFADNTSVESSRQQISNPNQQNEDVPSYDPDIKDCSAVPYAGDYSIKVNPVTRLDGMTLEEIAGFRVQKVKEYEILNIFPPDYNPLQEPHSRIYGSITSGANWLYSAQFYITNPYFLIVISGGNYVNPLAEVCENVEISYSNASIEESYKAEDALKWFKRLYSYKDCPGIIRIWMVNAYDAGFFYASVDTQKSSNIDLLWNYPPEHIINAVYSNSGCFHLGRKGVNNLSPLDNNAQIKLKTRDAETVIYVKLWRESPVNKNQKADFSYLVKIIP